MSFRLILKSVTLNDLERRNGPNIAIFYRIWQFPRRMCKSGRQSHNYRTIYDYYVL